MQGDGNATELKGFAAPFRRAFRFSKSNNRYWWCFPAVGHQRAARRNGNSYEWVEMCEIRITFNMCLRKQLQENEIFLYMLTFIGWYFFGKERPSEKWLKRTIGNKNLLVMYCITNKKIYIYNLTTECINVYLLPPIILPIRTVTAQNNTIDGSFYIWLLLDV